MSFYLNNAQQMALDDSLYNLTEREMKHLMSSWAETFSKKVFAAISFFTFQFYINIQSVVL